MRPTRIKNPFVEDPHQSLQGSYIKSYKNLDFYY